MKLVTFLVALIVASTLFAMNQPKNNFADNRALEIYEQTGYLIYCQTEPENARELPKCDDIVDKIYPFVDQLQSNKAFKVIVPGTEFKTTHKHAKGSESLGNFEYRRGSVLVKHSASSEEIIAHLNSQPGAEAVQELQELSMDFYATSGIHFNCQDETKICSQLMKNLFHVADDIIEVNQQDHIAVGELTTGPEFAVHEKDSLYIFRIKPHATVDELTQFFRGNIRMQVTKRAEEELNY